MIIDNSEMNFIERYFVQFAVFNNYLLFKSGGCCIIRKQDNNANGETFLKLNRTGIFELFGADFNMRKQVADCI